MSDKFCIEAYGGGAATYTHYRNSLEEAKLAADQDITLFEYCGSDVYEKHDDETFELTGAEYGPPIYSVSSKVPGIIDGREHEAPPPMPRPTLGFWFAAALYAYMPYMIAAITVPLWGPFWLADQIKKPLQKKPKYSGTVRPLAPIQETKDK